MPILNARQNDMQQKNAWDEQLEKIIGEIKNGLVESSGTEMEQRHFFDKRLFLYMPKDLEKMTDEHVKIKYPNENRPKLLYTNDTDSINMGISMIENEDEERLIDEDAEAFRDVMLESLIAVSPTSKILDKGTFLFDGDMETKVTAAYYCFDSFALGGAMYSLVFITILDDALVIVNLNCQMKSMEENKLLFYGIMHTAKVINES